MAKRMFSDEIILSDAFLSMKSDTIKLYFVLNFMADNDGVINRCKVALATSGCSEENYFELIQKGFIIDFPSLSICVIKHWWIHNTKRTDRYAESNYQELQKWLEIKPNKSYTLTPLGNQMSTKLQPNVSLNSISISNSNSISNTLGQKEPQQIAITSEQVKSDGAGAKKKNSNILFERFWKAYPKKVGKDKCLRFFQSKSSIDKSLVDKMLVAIEEQSKTEQWQKEKGQFIPHPYTWLNQGRWQDEMTVETNEVKTAQEEVLNQDKKIKALKEESLRQILIKRDDPNASPKSKLRYDIEYKIAIGEITEEEGDKILEEQYLTKNVSQLDFSKVAKKILGGE